jgi:antitoxin component YwqK of YwqJK toxin-antitoxin module
MEINYYHSGSIASIKSYIKGKMDGEQLWFYDNGFVEQKRVFKDGIPDGPWYVYYPSGAIKNFRYTINNKDVAGVDYWEDTIGIIKSSLHFNDSGQIFYKKNFDQFGNFIDEEGIRPNYR